MTRVGLTPALTLTLVTGPAGAQDMDEVKEINQGLFNAILHHCDVLSAKVHHKTQSEHEIGYTLCYEVTVRLLTKCVEQMTAKGEAWDGCR